MGVHNLPSMFSSPEQKGKLGLPQRGQFSLPHGILSVRLSSPNHPTQGRQSELPRQSSDHAIACLNLLTVPYCLQHRAHTPQLHLEACVTHCCPCNVLPQRVIPLGVATLLSSTFSSSPHAPAQPLSWNFPFYTTAHLVTSYLALRSPCPITLPQKTS